MRICSRHRADLRRSLDGRGLGHLIGATTDEAVAAIVRLASEADLGDGDFDPLLTANWAIMNAFLHGTDHDWFAGDVCPVCEVEADRAGLGGDWLDATGNEMLRIARAQGLAPLEQ